MTGFTNRKELLSEMQKGDHLDWDIIIICLLYTSPSPRDS